MTGSFQGLLMSGGSSFTPITNSYTAAGSGTETVPTGATNVVIEIWGGGGGGAHGTASVAGTGGGSGGYSRTSIACSGGQTIAYTVGQLGGGAPVGGSAISGLASSASSGTLTITTMTANGGTAGSSGGAGGTASGGTLQNTTGNAGSAGTGGAAVVFNSDFAGRGGDGSPDNVTAGSNGFVGKVKFSYT